MAKEVFVCLGAFNEQKIISYCVFEPVSEDITQIAVDKQNSRKGVASLLLDEIIRINKNDSVKVVNTDFLQFNNYFPYFKKHNHERETV